MSCGSPDRHQASPADAIALPDREVLALGDQVLAGSPTSGTTSTLRLPWCPCRVHGAVDLADDRVILRFAGFEQLGHAGQTASDVLGLGGLARDLAITSPAST